MAIRRIPFEEGRVALAQAVAGETARPVQAMAVRYLLEELAEKAPGGTLEVRVPPFGATQCVAGPKHTRGTPPNVVEMNAETWISLATGSLGWDEALQSARVTASGTRATLEGLLPVVRRPAGAE